MSAVSLILVLLAAAAALRVLAERFDIPHPALLVLGGLLLAVMPGLPRATLEPDVVFLIFVPPLLYIAAYTTSWRDFTESLRPILLAAIGLVLVTMAGVAAVAHVMVPLAWPAAFLLGAIVAPSDAVATTAVTRRLSVRHQISTLLDGESLVNDATAFVAYRMAVTATVFNQFSLSQAVERFVWAGAGGIAIGVAVGYAVVWLRHRVSALPEVDSAISLITPFAAFIPAERLGLSSVLAVVAVGAYVGRQGPRAVSPEMRIHATDVWTTVVFVLEGLIFILIGLDLPLVLQTVERERFATLVWYGVAISGTVIVLRIAWAMSVGLLRQRLEKWLKSPSVIFSKRELFFIGWAGLRGADSLVIALALPLTVAGGGAFPGRGVIIFITFIVIFVTLVVQGFTLRPLIRMLRLGGDTREESELVEARLRTAKAGLARLDVIIAREPVLAQEASRLRSQHRHRVHRFLGRRRRQIHRRDESRAEDYERVRRTMIDAEREELIRLRDSGVIGDEVMRELQRELDLEQVLLDSERTAAKPDSPD
jgi:monovalent cation/hydrogen antiporter